MFWNMILNAYNNMLAINKIRIIIERLHNVIVICMQYLNIATIFYFCGHCYSIAAMFYEILQ